MVQDAGAPALRGLREQTVELRWPQPDRWESEFLRNYYWRPGRPDESAAAVGEAVVPDETAARPAPRESRAGALDVLEKQKTAAEIPAGAVDAAHLAVKPEQPTSLQQAEWVEQSGARESEWSD